MAEALKEAGGKSGRKAKKEKVEKTPQNTQELKANMEKFLAEMDGHKNDQEKMNGEFAVDIGNTKERYANMTGYSRKHLTKIYNKHRRALKEQADYAELEESDREALDTLEKTCEGIKGSPLFLAAKARLEKAN